LSNCCLFDFTKRKYLKHLKNIKNTIFAELTEFAVVIGAILLIFLITLPIAHFIDNSVWQYNPNP